jgi:hypothetical protein
MAAKYHPSLLVAKYCPIPLPRRLVVTRVPSNGLANGLERKMVAKPDALTNAVRYHDGAFPPKALDYERLLGPLAEAAALLAR